MRRSELSPEASAGTDMIAGDLDGDVAALRAPDNPSRAAPGVHSAVTDSVVVLALQRYRS